jgi:hypothetical protein
LAPPSPRYSPGKGQKSSKCGRLPTGKIIPYTFTARLRNDWNVGRPRGVGAAKETVEETMYIGLGGILILILILWLLGVI